ncbi:hypothetical protein F1880_003922 [Penicillium rolfsii]|nr:hypothetical protein F1880_003922 [Penicillium rolfsii]
MYLMPYRSPNKTEDKLVDPSGGRDTLQPGCLVNALPANGTNTTPGHDGDHLDRIRISAFSVVGIAMENSKATALVEPPNYCQLADSDVLISMLDALQYDAPFPAQLHHHDRSSTPPESYNTPKYVQTNLTSNAVLSRTGCVDQQCYNHFTMLTTVEQHWNLTAMRNPDGDSPMWDTRMLPFSTLKAKRN